MSYSSPEYVSRTPGGGGTYLEKGDMVMDVQWTRSPFWEHSLNQPSIGMIGPVLLILPFFKARFEAFLTTLRFFSGIQWLEIFLSLTYVSMLG